jgi:hypothetical protein
MGPLPFAVFTAMVGGNVPLEGNKGVGWGGFVADPRLKGLSKTFLLLPFRCLTFSADPKLLKIFRLRDFILHQNKF